MTKYAKIVNDRLVYASAADFPGVPHWDQHEVCVRNKKFLPVSGEPEQREGYSATPSRWHVVEVPDTFRTEPRQVEIADYTENPETHEMEKTGSHMEMRDTEIAVHHNYIQIDEWVWHKLPDPIPSDTTDRDNAEKAIVAAIVALAKEYDALSELEDMDDITIPNLRELATTKGVTDGAFDALVTKLTPYKWQLEAVNGTTWAQCWEGLKSRFAQWVHELEA